MIELIPITQREAHEWVTRTHRHLPAPRGDLFRVALNIDGRLTAVGIAGRPARMLQDGRTAEIVRVASVAEPTVNACSRLYSALVRAGRALGYRRFVTYTLLSEPGTSLRASGFQDDGLTKGGEWGRAKRPRHVAVNSSPKRRWLYPARASGLWA